MAKPSATTDFLSILNRDVRILFATRIMRLFAYGLLSVVLVLYLREDGLSLGQIGTVLTLTLVGDTVTSLWITTRADRHGRRRMLLIGAALMLFAGVMFAWTNSIVLLIVAAAIGVISPSGNEIGPFLSIEQAALSESIQADQRTRVFAWYNLVGSFATAAGALCGGASVQALIGFGMTPLMSYRWVVIAYAGFGILLAILFMGLSPDVEVQQAQGDKLAAGRLGLHRSRNVVLKLSALFALDAFGGGFVIQSIIAYWFASRFHTPPVVLGGIFMAANVLAGVSALSAARIAARFGLINTMVFTHIPSNVLLMMVPLMPNLSLAITMLLLRFSISQMDVPTRQAYTMSVVDPDERSAASGVTAVARSVGASLSPIIAGPLLAVPTLAAMPFFISGGLKIVYDLLLYRNFQAVESRPEMKVGAA